jgi:hypothetical protein
MKTTMEFILRVEIENDKVQVSLHNVEDVFEVEPTEDSPEDVLNVPGTTTYGMDYVSTFTSDMDTIKWIIPIDIGFPEDE